MCNLIFEQFPDAEFLSGAATAGIALGAMSADQLKIPYIYVRPKPKGHGMGNQIEGFYKMKIEVMAYESGFSNSATFYNAFKKRKRHPSN